MASTVFLVPLGALGFEICTEYNQRTTLQTVRSVASMAFNLAGPALAWSIFFRASTKTESTNIVANYAHMGTVFTLIAVILIVAVVVLTRNYMLDSRNHSGIESPGVSDCFSSLRDTLMDPYARAVFLVLSVASFGVVLVASLQMYVYVFFMKFSPPQRSVAHGMSMVACAIGALLAPVLVKWIDKKSTVIVSLAISLISSIVLICVFLTGLVPMNLKWAVIGIELPIAGICFILFASLYWLGVGILTPVAFSMMADISELNKFYTGYLKDGSYSAMLSFISKATASLAMLVSGFCLSWAGFIVGQENQSSSAVWNIAAITFLSGASFAGICLVLIRNYSVTKTFMEQTKADLAKMITR